MFPKKLQAIIYVQIQDTGGKTENAFIGGVLRKEQEDPCFQCHLRIVMKLRLNLNLHLLQGSLRFVPFVFVYVCIIRAGVYTGKNTCVN